MSNVRGNDTTRLAAMEYRSSISGSHASISSHMHEERSTLNSPRPQLASSTTSTRKERWQDAMPNLDVLPDLKSPQRAAAGPSASPAESPRIRRSSLHRSESHGSMTSSAALRISWLATHDAMPDLQHLSKIQAANNSQHSTQSITRRSQNDPVSRVSHTGASSATGAGLSSNPIYDGRQSEITLPEYTSSTASNSMPRISSQATISTSGVERKSRRKSLIDWIANLGLSASSNSIEDKVSPTVSLKNNKLSRRRSGAMGEGVSAADQIAASVGLPRVLSGKEMRLLKKGPESFKTSNVSPKTTVISTDKRASPSQPEASQQKLPVTLGRRATLASPYSDQGHASNLERHSLSIQQSGEPVTSNNLPLSPAPAHIQSASDKAPWPSAMSSVGASSSSTVISQTSSVCEKTELTSTPFQKDRMRLTSPSSICGPAPATSAEVPEHVDSPTQVSQPSHLSLASPRRPAAPPPSTLDTSHLSPRARCKGPTSDGASFSVSRPTSRFTPPGSPLDNLVSPSSLSRSLAASGRSRAMAHQELEAGVQPAHSVQPTLPGWLMD